MIDDRYLSDAAHFPGGHASGVAVPHSVEEVPDLVRSGRSVLVVGAQSSLTGGATPMGELVLSTEKLTRILDIGPGYIRVEAGVAVAVMQDALAGVGAWFPPAPTFTGAFAGGIVATNAAGAATFKYGSVRRWVEAITVVLADGTELTLGRGDIAASNGVLRVPSVRGSVAVPVPSYRMPDVVKRSAGYHAEPEMDLVDLFIGSEGTLGVVTTVTFRTLSPAPLTALALIPCATEPQALALVADLRRDSSIAAIEHMDRRCLDILREDGADARNGVAFPEGTEIALLAQIEVPSGTTRSTAFDEIGSALASGTERPGAAGANEASLSEPRSRRAPDNAAPTPLARICRVLNAHGVFDTTEIALPGDEHRRDQLVAIREAVPAGVNARVGRAQRDIDPRIAKTAADMIVPFDRFAEMMAIYREGFRSRGLDFAVWGHISDGNVHPNVLPRSYEDVELGKDALLSFGRDVARLGGCPLAEHGVGRNPVKQALLRGLYGEAGLEQMRAVKRALDPDWTLAPGVIFEKR
ncbi:MAG: FAD-binding oxidoreductase [Vicinamibacterales bacterium]